MSTVSNFLRRAIKSVIGLIVASAMIISCEAVNGPGGEAVGKGAALSASRGNVGAVILIETEADLADIGIGLPASGDYELADDLVLTNWTPICDPNAGIDTFTGTFDGEGHTITINSFDSGAVSGTYLGIFAVADGATFSDLTVDVEAGTVTPVTSQYVGGLVAYATGATFDGITVTGALDVNVSTKTDLDVGLVAGYAETGSTFTGTDIEAGLNVQYSSGGNTNVNAGGIAGYLVNSYVDGAFVDGRFNVNANMPYEYTGTNPPGNGVSLGGAAGYAANTSFDDVTVGARTTVSAISAYTPVYIGGVVGNGFIVTVTDSESAAVISGNGPGYNTSGGGVAGYLVQSSVDNSSASGNITLNGTWGGDEDSLWQIYAGGLVGYSGGTTDGNGTITSSGASGNVIANAPYPYAGGLVGYNYGFNDFTSAEARLNYYRYHDTKGVTVTYNGGLITRSYATGNATANSTPGSNGLPYAGGLAGYSSIPTAKGSPNIENCYATGDATVTTNSKYGWAGGLLGANAQGSIVSKCYALGNVSVKVGSNELPFPQDGTNPGAAGGGIAGVNYYTDASSGLDPIIEHSVALNALITGSAPYGVPYLLHRVAGDLGTVAFGQGELLDNSATSTMVISPEWDPEIGPDLRDGASIGPGQAAFDGWDFTNVWTKGADGYPALR
jgi:hypothetical protein